MKKSPFLFVTLIFLMIFLPGCGGVKATEPSIAGQIAATSEAIGNFNLPDSTVGLSNLQSYHQSLLTTFEGTINDEQTVSNVSLIREVMDTPPTYLSWIDIGDLPMQFFGRIGSINYHQPSPEASCTASPVNDADPQQDSATFQLAALPPISGAQFSNEEEVNGVAAKHYTFDEAAIGYGGQATAQGEVWVASSGGYVLRYSLRLEALLDILGPGVKGVQTWLYELSEVNTAISKLPELCQQLQESTNVPMLDNATMVLQQPGYSVYQVNVSVEDAIVFYQQQAETLGWAISTPISFDNGTRITLRPPDDSMVQLTFEPDGNLLTVTVQTLAPITAE